MNNIFGDVVSGDGGGGRKRRAAEANTAYACTLGRKIMGGGGSGKWGIMRPSYTTMDVHTIVLLLRWWAAAESGGCPVAVCVTVALLPCLDTKKKRERGGVIEMDDASERHM